MSGMFPEEQVVDSYLRHSTLKEEKDFWAFDEVNQIVRCDLAAGWRLTCLLVNKASSDEALAYVAAGPLEDLLTFNGPTLIDHVAVAARADKRLQLALSGVWLNRANPVWERWFALMNEFGFADGKRGAPLTKAMPTSFLILISQKFNASAPLRAADATSRTSR
jgi:hypothetical protein